jgi:dethiobiotin synthetase
MPQGSVLCITGIDTDIGKTVATGLLGRYLRQQGYTVITQKIVQTGCLGLSDDIAVHRQLMRISLQDADRKGLTCPYIFPEPCSPHLAASLAGKEIDCAVITEATTELRRDFDYVLLEGVGGLLVPLNTEWTLLDYLEEAGYPLILVSSPRLGSINHTLAALELAKNRGLHVLGILYNRFDEDNPVIAKDTAKIFSIYLKKHGFANCVFDLHGCKTYSNEKGPDFRKLLDGKDWPHRQEKRQV